ncbi:apoptosis antagonizing transcription factor-domain-containing protein [Roridomyces roridus]|uniref:Protein BFR2 n=1 Tax=Roridomyces roridus TaxID=1738132 RepID=A0AAD7BK36_9AGAR|nr:apoptosis antagonizing transcription factor-domain-containing protein [Roridomyces roridus]
MTARLSLAEQIAQLQEAAPVDFDPEDVHAAPEVTELEQADDETNAREHYLDVGPSALRRLQSIADPKYEGVKISRKQLMESGDEPSDLESEGDMEGEDLDNESDSEDAQSGGDDDEEVPQSEPEEVEKMPPQKSNSDAEPVEDLPASLKKTREDDRRKGKAVSQQISIWETLLDARIRLQKSVTAANQLPSSSQLSQLTEMPECRESLHNMLEEAFLLSDEIFDLQEKLLAADDSIAPPPRKRRKLQSNEDFSTKLHEATTAASALEHAYHPHLVQTLSKWSSKIQAVAPSVLLPSNRNAFSSRNSQNLKSAVQLVDETLSDHRKLIERTQMRRGKGIRLGETAEEEDEENKLDVEVFDDTDFYQQLLRDIIDSRGNGPGSNDWMAAQKQKKAKKKVDTKASKGRKIRYEAHEKLQNFMVPVPVAGMWHEEQIDELFSSLLGAGFEGAIGKEDAVDEPAIQDVMKGGFKVFG